MDVYTNWEGQLIENYGLREGKNLFKIAREYTEEKYSSLFERKKQLQYLVSKLLENYPIQYLINKAWFYEYTFYVDERVLIPRPETEELVEMAINLIPPNANVLDIGTGSGCIAITLGKKTNATITGLDKSFDALEVAKKNAQWLNTRIKFQQLDILDKNDQNQLTDQYDLIISNPPYISIYEKGRMGQNVLNREPDSALFVDGPDVLIFYKEILKLAERILKKDGMVLFESNEYNAHQVLRLINSYKKFSGSYLYNDLSGKPRMVLFKK